MMARRWDAPATAVPEYACAEGMELVLDGELFDVELIRSKWNLPTETAPNAAETALEAYRRLGPAFIDVLNGRFVIVLADSRTRRIVAFGDRIGLHPLYYANSRNRVLFSSSIPALLAQSDVSRTVNRVAIAQHLLHRWANVKETYHAAVARIPPAHTLTIDESNQSLQRYWSPARPIAWLKEEDLGKFDGLFERAVRRSIRPKGTGIFLSGGLDSVSVAAVAIDVAQRSGHVRPHALSLGFPEPECDEEFLQRSVAQSLGMSQNFIAFDDAMSGRGLIQPALEMTATLPQPLLNNWAPAYEHLGGLAVKRGCRVILTGTGGDEWLNVTPLLAADYIRNRRFRDLGRLLRVQRRSFTMTRLEACRNLIWRFGLRPLIGATAANIAPERWRSRQIRKLGRSIPSWVAPDLSIRRALDDRAPLLLNQAKPVGALGFYVSEMHTALDHLLVVMDYEEMFDFRRRVGARMLHPYLDRDVIEFLYRTPPDLLTRGGRSKGLVRETVNKRFPQLGFERQRKVYASDFFKNLLLREGRAAWNRLGGLTALSSLGIVNRQQAADRIDDLLRGKRTMRETYRIWTMMNLEAWARAHI